MSEEHPLRLPLLLFLRHGFDHFDTGDAFVEPGIHEPKLLLLGLGHRIEGAHIVAQRNHQAHHENNRHYQ